MYVGYVTGVCPRYPFPCDLGFIHFDIKQNILQYKAIQYSTWKPLPTSDDRFYTLFKDRVLFLILTYQSSQVYLCSPKTSFYLDCHVVLFNYL